MKKIEIINVKTPEMPKDHQVTDLNEIYFAHQNIKEESLNDYFGENGKMVKIKDDYKKALENLEKILEKYYFLKLFKNAADKANDFNVKMLTMDKYINQVKKYFMDLKKYRNAYSKKNIPTDDETKDFYYKICDFKKALVDIKDDLATFEKENYPKIKMSTYNACKGKTYQELENLANEVNNVITSYKTIEDAYDYVCYNSGNLVFETIESILKVIEENPEKSKVRINKKFFFEDEIIMYLDYVGWIELFNKLQYLIQKCDASVFNDEVVSKNYQELEKNYLIVLIYNEYVSRGK